MTVDSDANHFINYVSISTRANWYVVNIILFECTLLWSTPFSKCVPSSSNAIPMWCFDEHECAIDACLLSQGLIIAFSLYNLTYDARQKQNETKKNGAEKKLKVKLENMGEKK